MPVRHADDMPVPSRGALSLKDGSVFPSLSSDTQATWRPLPYRQSACTQNCRLRVCRFGALLWLTLLLLSSLPTWCVGKSIGTQCNRRTQLRLVNALWRFGSPQYDLPVSGRRRRRCWLCVHGMHAADYLTVPTLFQKCLQLSPASASGPSVYQARQPTAAPSTGGAPVVQSPSRSSIPSKHKEYPRHHNFLGKPNSATTKTPHHCFFRSSNQLLCYTDSAVEISTNKVLDSQNNSISSRRRILVGSRFCAADWQKQREFKRQVAADSWAFVSAIRSITSSAGTPFRRAFRSSEATASQSRNTPRLPRFTALETNNEFQISESARRYSGRRAIVSSLSAPGGSALHSAPSKQPHKCVGRIACCRTSVVAPSAVRCYAVNASAVLSDIKASQSFSDDVAAETSPSAIESPQALIRPRLRRWCSGLLRLWRQRREAPVWLLGAGLQRTSSLQGKCADGSRSLRTAAPRLFVAALLGFPSLLKFAALQTVLVATYRLLLVYLESDDGKYVYTVPTAEKLNGTASSSPESLPVSREEPKFCVRLGPDRLRVNLFGVWWLLVTAGWISLALPTLAVIRAVTELTGRLGWLGDWVGWGWARATFWSFGCSPKVEGLEHLPSSDKAVFFMANHASFYDIYAMMGFIPWSIRFISKIELFRIPFLGWCMALIGHIGIDRGILKSQLHAFRHAVQVLRQGTSLAAYPEETRSPDGRLMSLKPGTFRLAQRAGVPIIPVSLRNLHKPYPPSAALPLNLPRNVVIQLHKPVATQGRPLGDLIREVENAIKSGLSKDELPAHPALSLACPGQPITGGANWRARVRKRNGSAGLWKTPSESSSTTTTTISDSLIANNVLGSGVNAVRSGEASAAIAEAVTSTPVSEEDVNTSSGLRSPSGVQGDVVGISGTPNYNMTSSATDTRDSVGSAEDTIECSKSMSVSTQSMNNGRNFSRRSLPDTDRVTDLKTPLVKPVISITDWAKSKHFDSDDSNDTDHGDDYLEGEDQLMKQVSDEQYYFGKDGLERVYENEVGLKHSESRQENSVEQGADEYLERRREREKGDMVTDVRTGDCQIAGHRRSANAERMRLPDGVLLEDEDQDGLGMVPNEVQNDSQRDIGETSVGCAPPILRNDEENPKQIQRAEMDETFLVDGRGCGTHF